MKIFRVAVCVVFVAVTVLFGTLYVKDKLNTDSSVPVITVDSDLTEVSVSVTDEQLLAGVTAYDEKDGDITDKIIVESVSKFSEKGVCKVTYAVCDSDNHVATAFKKIKYTDYTSPEFYAHGSLCFSVSETINLSGVIGATDCIDGDISSNLILTSQNIVSRVEGNYIVDATVTNSRGDTSTLEIPVKVEPKSITAPEINLKEYIVYTDLNKSVSPKSYIKSVTDKNGNEIDVDVTIKSDINFKAPGIYTVDFYAKDEEGNEGHDFMVVVVGSGDYE